MQPAPGVDANERFSSKEMLRGAAIFFTVVFCLMAFGLGILGTKEYSGGKIGEISGTVTSCSPTSIGISTFEQNIQMHGAPQSICQDIDKADGDVTIRYQLAKKDTSWGSPKTRARYYRCNGDECNSDKPHALAIKTSLADITLTDVTTIPHENSQSGYIYIAVVMPFLLLSLFQYTVWAKGERPLKYPAKKRDDGITMRSVEKAALRNSALYFMLSLIPGGWLVALFWRDGRIHYLLLGLAIIVAISVTGYAYWLDRLRTKMIPALQDGSLHFVQIKKITTSKSFLVGVAKLDGEKVYVNFRYHYRPLTYSLPLLVVKGDNCKPFGIKPRHLQLLIPGRRREMLAEEVHRAFNQYLM